MPIGAEDPTVPVDLDNAGSNMFIAGDATRSEGVKISFGTTLEVHGLSSSAALCPRFYNANRNKRFRGGFDPSLVPDAGMRGPQPKSREEDHGSSGSAKTHLGKGGTTMGPKAPAAGCGLEKHEI